MGGADTKVEALGVKDWQYIGGGYEVSLLYRITTPMMSFPMLITVQGRDSKRAEGRQWNIRWEKTALGDVPPPVMTEDWKRKFPLGNMARIGFLNEWLGSMREGADGIGLPDDLAAGGTRAGGKGVLPSAAWAWPL